MRDIGLLIIRVGLGASMIAHGYPKLLNPDKWGWLGSQMVHLGVNFAPEVFGFLAGFVETFGGLFLLIGLFFRTTNLALAFTMFVAFMYHLNQNDPYGPTSHALELLCVFIGLSLIGPGKFSLAKKSL